MTAGELIKALIDCCSMDEDVELFIDEPHENEHGKCSGYGFDIDRVKRGYRTALIVFKDWRVTADDE